MYLIDIFYDLENKLPERSIYFHIYWGLSTFIVCFFALVLCCLFMFHTMAAFKNVTSEDDNCCDEEDSEFENVNKLML